MRRAREAYEAERQAAVKAAAQPAPAEAAPAQALAAEAPAPAAEAAPASEPAATPEPVVAAPAEPAREPIAAAEPTPAAEPAPIQPAAEPAEVAAAEPAPESPAAELDAASLAPAPRAQLREVGFRQLPGVSRVFVRTTVTPRFSVEDAGENVIRVELENTRAARRNDLRFLDTSFFPSAVAMVTPIRRGSSYVVEIKLKERVPYQQRIEGDMLALDFARPAAVAAASVDAAAADAPLADPVPAAPGEPLEAIPAGDAPAPVAAPGR
jgi:hypothetical protein